jgi:uncharacterized protein DUF4012
VLLVVALAAFTGYQAVKVRSNLEKVASELSTLGHQLSSGDQAGARRTLHSAQQHASNARRASSGPGWWLGQRLPKVGDDVGAVRTVADVADNLAHNVLPDVVAAGAALRPERLRPVHGRVNLAPIRAAAPKVVRANARLQVQDARVQSIDTGALLSQVAGPVDTMQTRLDDASSLTDRLSRAVRLLPPMLGADGRRTYLLMFQNNAEARSTGGIPGSFATVTADHGKVAIGRQADASLVGSLAKPPLPLTRQELALFGPGLGTYAQDVNFTPDFPRSAQLIRAMWKARTGVTLDGVLSADPVALSYLLRGTGPVPIAGGRTLTAGDAVQTLLSSVYAEIPDPQRQNLFFESVAHSVFDAVASGQGRPATVLSNLVTAVDQRRVLLWSAHRQEQALLDPTSLAGALARSPAKAPTVGVYLNDGGASKLDYYLGYSVDVASRACQSDRQVLDVTLHLRSRVPKGAAGLPDYVANNAAGLPRGVIRLSLFTYAPVHGGFGRSTLDGRTNNLSPRPHDGRTVVAQTVDLAPGTSHTLTWQMITGKGQTDRTQLRVTPGAHTDGVGHVGRSAC